MRSEYFSHNILAGNINRWKNITADGLFRKNGTTTIWIWKHWNNLMVDNCSKSNSNWEIDDWMVRTEVKLLKSYPNKYIYIVQLKEKKKKKKKIKKNKLFQCFHIQMVVVPFLRNNPSAVVFSAVYISRQNIMGKIFGAHLGFSLQVIHS